MTAYQDSGNDNIQVTSSAVPPRYWPEEVRSQPHIDKFPWTALTVGLLPGFVAIVLLFVLFIWLSNRAGRQIVFVNANGQLNAVQANRENMRPIGDSPLQLSTETQKTLESVLPVLGLPRWSPDGNQLATTISVGSNVQAAIFLSETGRVNVLRSILNNTNTTAFPGDGWSPDSAHLALLETDGQRAFFALVDLSQTEPIVIPIDLPIDTRAGLDWHPSSEQLLITTLPDAALSSTVQVLRLDGQAQPFVPNDEGLLRADAVWSPDGQSIAYIAVDPAQLQQTGLLVGDLWIADSYGNNPRQLVGEGLNLAPIWNEADQSFIYFTRYFTDTDSYDLYRVNFFGQPSLQRVGSSNPALIEYPLDRQHFLKWSNDDQPLEIAAATLPATNQQGWTPDRIVRATIQNALPMLGTPHWSPDGRYLASTSWQEGKILPTVYNANLQPVSALDSVFDVLAVPTDGWSADGSVLALVEHDGIRSLLALATEPFTAQNVAPFDFTLDIRAGIDWHPLQNKLLVTGYTEDEILPMLLVVDAGGQTQPFTTNDGHLWHADGAWSPDGSQVVYVAGDIYTSTQDILPGELWVAGSDGSNPRPLVTDVQAVAPVWNPAGDTIYYTRLTGELGLFSLHRVAADGSTLTQYMGPGSETIVLYPWDRNLFLQWSPDGSQLLFVGATPIPPAWYVAHAPNSETMAQIQIELPVLGEPQWSPDGQQFAGTVLDEQNVRVVWFRSPTGPPILTPPTTDWFVMPSDGWSQNGMYLALLRHDGSALRLAVMDTIRLGLATSSFILDTRAGLSWHPTEDRIMVTAKEESITPTLRIYNVLDSTSEIFSPEDGQIVRVDGVWSPSGEQVAYVAQDTLAETLGTQYLAGTLWVADSDGQNVRLLVPDGLNLAPLWDMAHERILFTRLVTETDTFDLYQVNLEGGVVERLGPSTPAWAQYPFDRLLFRRWSPEGARWLLPGGVGNLPFVYHAVDRNSVIAPLPIDCSTSEPFVVQWAPTDRGVLVGCPPGKIFLHWLDSERAHKEYSDGLYPAWQP